jgi:superoxide reductase
VTARLGDRIQIADWKKEKHVPVIECPDEVGRGQPFEVRVGIGKRISHPNSTEHHIRWIALCFQPQDAKFVYDVGRIDFAAHGESVAGPNQGPVYTHHSGALSLAWSEPGTILALSYCNIHGLWESSKEIRLI